MHKKLTLLLLVAGMMLSAQTKRFSPAQIQTDAQTLHSFFKFHHPNLYLYASKEKVDSFFAVLGTLKDSMDEKAFYNKVSLFSSLIKDGHTLFFPSSASLNYHNENAGFFPFKVFWKDQKLFLEANYAETNRLEDGTEILSINGLTSQEVMDFCLSRLMRDGYNLNYPIWVLNNYFSEYYSYFFGHPERFDLAVKHKNGELDRVEVAALRKVAIRANRMERYGNQAKARGLNQLEGDGIILKFDSSSPTAILSIRDFDSEVLKGVYHQNFKRILQGYFQRIAAAKTENLILDLRGNQGGNLRYGVILLSYLLQQDFQILERYSVVQNAEKEPGQERNKTKKAYGTGVFKPRSNAFKGQVFLLADGGSFSNSVIVASAFRYYQRGKIIGEETGGNKNIFSGFGEMVTLPNTRLSIYGSFRGLQLRNAHENDGHGIVPDIEISPGIECLVNGKDEALGFVLDLIQKQDQGALKRKE